MTRLYVVETFYQKPEVLEFDNIDEVMKQLQNWDVDFGNLKPFTDYDIAFNDVRDDLDNLYNNGYENPNKLNGFEDYEVLFRYRSRYVLYKKDEWRDERLTKVLDKK